MKENKKVVKFLIYALGLCISWFFLYDIWFSDFDNRLALRIADASAGLLNFIGYDVETESSAVLLAGQPLVYIGPACNGMVLMALFTGFILAYPGPWLKKLFYIPIGIVLINLLNVMRVAALALNALYSTQTLAFNHKYTFTIVVYAFIFILWMLWVKRFSIQNNHVITTS